MGVLRDIFKGVMKKQPPASADDQLNERSSYPLLASSSSSLTQPAVERGENKEREQREFLDPFTPRSTDNLPPNPNIEVPPPLPRRQDTSKESNVRDEGKSIEKAGKEMRREHLDPLLPPHARTALSSPRAGEEEERMDKYGIVDDDTVDKASHDKIEEIINDLRFLRAQNDMIMEMLKRIERKLP